MSHVGLEIHDAGLLLVDQSNGGRPRTPPSPGFALMDDRHLMTGIEAALKARLHPRRVFHRFWRDLATARLEHPLFRDYSSADLAHAHLSELWRSAPPDTEAVWIAAPGSMTDHQLGLMLAIARACGMPVGGLVDASLAACSAQAGRPRTLYLDLELHRAVLTEIAVGDELVCRRHEIDDSVGLLALQECWMKRVAETFVRRTRFDPFHSAPSEQALHRGLLQWLAARTHDDVARIDLQARDAGYSVEIRRDDMIGFVDQPYAALADLVGRLTPGAPARLLLSDRVALLPGLAERLGASAQALPAGAAAAGALRHRAQLGVDGEEMLFVTRLVLRERQNAQT